MPEKYLKTNFFLPGATGFFFYQGSAHFSPPPSLAMRMQYFTALSSHYIIHDKINLSSCYCDWSLICNFTFSDKIQQLVSHNGWHFFIHFPCVFLSTYLSVYFLSHWTCILKKSQNATGFREKRIALIKDNDVYRFNKTSSSVSKTLRLARDYSSVNITIRKWH